MMQVHGTFWTDQATSPAPAVKNEKTLSKRSLDGYLSPARHPGRQQKDLNDHSPDQSQRITAWTDQRIKGYRRIVLVSAAPWLQETSGIVEATLEGFAGTNVLVIALAGKEAVMLRRKFLHHNLIIEASIPFDEVMPFADVYVTDGDYNSICHGVRHKLPVVVAGLCTRSAGIREHVGDYDYGINLQTDAPTAENIRCAVHCVLEDKRYLENVTRLRNAMADDNAPAPAWDYSETLT